MLFTQVTGETLSSQDIDEVIDEINSTGVISSTFDPVDALIELVNNSDRLNQRVDVTAAYHVSIGKWHDSYSSFQNHVSNFVPLESMGSEEWVKDYIDYLLTSPDEGYLARFGVVPFLVGDDQEKIATSLQIIEWTLLRNVWKTSTLSNLISTSLSRIK